jgi:hypothetical protein
MTAIAMTAITHPPNPPEFASAAGLIEGLGVAPVGSALVGAAVDCVGDADVGKGPELVGEGPAYVKVMPPSMGWPSWDTTR